MNEPVGAGRSAGSGRVEGLTGGEDKRSFVQRLFSDIAPRYDWFNRLASLGLDQRWRRETVRRASIQPGMRVLDVCTGTGDLAILCARRRLDHGAVIAIDMNREMLACAQRKQQHRALVVRWLQGDAQALPFFDGMFDRVLIGFSTRNLSDLTEGLREMVRVLKPRGQLLVLETGRPSHPVIRAGYELFLFTVARVIGVVLTGKLWPFTYLARSVRRFLSPQQCMERLHGLRTDVEYVALSSGLASLYVATKR